MPLPRLLAFTIATLLVGAASPQSWSEADDLNVLRQPGRTLQLSLPTPPYPHPGDPIRIAMLLGTRPTVRVHERPPPELAELPNDLDADDIKQMRRSFARRFVAVGEPRATREYVEGLAEREAVVVPASDDEVRRARAWLESAALIGRIAGVTEHVNAVWIAADEIIVRNRPAGGAAVSRHHIVLDVTPEHEARGVLATRPGQFERLVLYNAVHELGHLFWFSLPPATRQEFTNRFWPDGQRPTRHETVSNYATTNPAEDFAECFVVACFYPTTYDTEPVLGRQVVPPGRGEMLKGPALDRVRFIDRRIDAVLLSGSPQHGIRDNRFFTIPERVTQPEDAESEPAEFDLRDALDGDD